MALFANDRKEIVCEDVGGGTSIHELVTLINHSPIGDRQRKLTLCASSRATTRPMWDWCSRKIARQMSKSTQAFAASTNGSLKSTHNKQVARVIFEDVDSGICLRLRLGHEAFQKFESQLKWTVLIMPEALGFEALELIITETGLALRGYSHVFEDDHDNLATGLAFGNFG